jgi:nitroreductase
MEFDESVRRRRSVRKYRGEDVPLSLVSELIDLARNAPSSLDRQPWTFIVVREAGTKQRLAEIKNRFCPPDKRAFPADFLTRAPVLIIVCVDGEAAGDRAVENGILAAAYLLLGAVSRGLGGVYLSAYQRDEPALAEAIRHLLAIPENVLPVTIVPLGYPAEAPPPKSLRPLKEMIRYEKF